MSDIHIEPGRLREIAGRILGDREFDYRPRLDGLLEQFITPTDYAATAMGDNESAGYIYGASQIGTFHDELLAELLKLYEDLDTGMRAVSNVLASAAEDFEATDEDAGDRLADTKQYFNPALGTSSDGSHESEPGFRGIR